MKVLFVGATGLVGRHIVPTLATDFELKLAAHEPGEMEGLPVRAVDIRDFEATEALVRESGVDAVVNCAIADYRSHTGTRDPEVALRYRQSTIEINAGGAYHLYEAAARAGIGKFVYISSMSIMSGEPKYERLDGSEHPRPNDVYACTKFFGEQVGAVYSAKYDMSVTCLRLGQPFPQGGEREARRMTFDGHRAQFAHFEDIAQAVGLALRQNVPFATYPIVSACHTPWVDPSCVSELGFVPRWHFSPEGARLVNEDVAAAG